MKWISALLAIGLVATWTIAQDLSTKLDEPGELQKTLTEGDRDASGRLPSPPPAPARPELAAADVRADAESIRRAWLLTQEASITLVSPTQDEEWTEGDDVELAWETSGPVDYVRIYYYGGRTQLGGRDRGMFEGFIAESIPNSGCHTFKMPWIDALSMGVRIAALDADGEKLADDERTVRFRPKDMADLKDEGTLIAVSKTRQRLYFQQDGVIKRAHIVSTAASGYWTPTMKPGSTDRRRGRMGQVFSKSSNAWSRMYHCWMPYWMAVTSSGSHGIHATSSNFYWRLGRPASHGCIRQHRADAKVLYGMVSVGTPVYVFP